MFYSFTGLFSFCQFYPPDLFRFICLFFCLICHLFQLIVSFYHLRVWLPVFFILCFLSFYLILYSFHSSVLNFVQCSFLSFIYLPFFLSFRSSFCPTFLAFLFYSTFVFHSTFLYSVLFFLPPLFLLSFHNSP